MEKEYAQALWEMIKRGTTPQKAVHALRESLAEHKREALLPRIARALERLAQREAATSDVTLTVARESDARTAHRAAMEALSAHSNLRVESHDLKTRVDDTIIGGWRLEGRETLIDASYKRQLLDLYGRVTKA